MALLWTDIPGRANRRVSPQNVDHARPRREAHLVEFFEDAGCHGVRAWEGIKPDTLRVWTGVRTATAYERAVPEVELARGNVALGPNLHEFCVVELNRPPYGTTQLPLIQLSAGRTGQIVYLEYEGQGTALQANTVQFDPYPRGHLYFVELAALRHTLPPAEFADYLSECIAAYRHLGAQLCDGTWAHAQGLDNPWNMPPLDLMTRGAFLRPLPLTRIGETGEDALPQLSVSGSIAGRVNLDNLPGAALTRTVQDVQLNRQYHNLKLEGPLWGNDVGYRGESRERGTEPMVLVNGGFRDIEMTTMSFQVNGFNRWLSGAAAEVRPKYHACCVFQKIHGQF